MPSLSRLKKVRTAIQSTPKAARKFGSTLVAEGRAEVARKGSSAQRFADAPLGQYYLPSKARTALGFVAPSPRKVGRDVRNVIRRPGFGTGAAAAGDVLSIAALPALASGAARAPRAIGTVARRTSAMQAVRGGEAGMLKFPQRGSVFARIKARVMNPIMQERERTAFVNRRIGEIRSEIKKLDASKSLPSTLKSSAIRAAKKGEQGWVRMQTKGGKTAIEMGPGKFAERAGKGSYAMTLEKSSTPQTMKVSWLEKTGAGPVNMSDVRGGMEAAKRHFAAKGFTKLEYEPLSASRTRLFQRTAGRIGIAAKSSLPDIRKATSALRSEAGFLRLPGGEGGEKAAREVVRRANLRATRSQMRSNLANMRFNLSMNTEKQLSGLMKDVEGMARGGLGKRAVMFEGTRVPAKTLGHLVKREQKARGAMKAIGMQPGKVVRQGASMIEIEGRMPMRAALTRLGESDVANIERAKIAPDVFQRMVKSHGVSTAKRWEREQIADAIRTQIKHTKRLRKTAGSRFPRN